MIASHSSALGGARSIKTRTSKLPEVGQVYGNCCAGPFEIVNCMQRNSSLGKAGQARVKLEVSKE
jgi:hypothetical protein